MDDVDELRLAVARALRREICGTPDSEARPSPTQFREFFAHKLRSREAATSGNYKVFGYSTSRAKQAINAILDGKPFFDHGIGAGNNATFESELIKYINSRNIEALPPIPLKLFRKGYDGRSTTFADISMISEGRDAEFIASQLFDICGDHRKDATLLESHRLKGIFIVGVVKLSPSVGKRAIGSITFSDLFDHSIDVDAADINFGKCSVSKIERVNPPNKPSMSDDDFSNHIYRVYRLVNNYDNDLDAIIKMKKDFLGKCIRIFAKLVIKYLEPMQDLWDESLGCGRLSRTVLDVEHGALFARQVDQGRLWVLALTSIQDTVDEGDELFGKSFIRSYEQALRVARSRKR